MRRGKLNIGVSTVAIFLALVASSIVGVSAANAEDDPNVRPVPAPNSSFETLQAQEQAQEQLQARVPEHQSLSPLLEPLASSAFDPAYIISDQAFYGDSHLSAASVQAFLNSVAPACRAGFTCLKDYTTPTVSRGGDAMCSPYAGSASESAATIIAKVGEACGISQKALLVILQKEQSLVTDDSPSARQYTAATGYACPDTAGCDQNYGGFYNQVYWSAWQLKRYGNPPGTSQYFTWFPVGSVSNIRYSPNADCGSSPVTIRNKATAALYYYTPYQPNAAALAGAGDACSAYGNLNFFGLYSLWFGSPVPGVPTIGWIDGVTTANGSITVAGWAADPSRYDLTSNVQIDLYVPSGGGTGFTVAASGSRPDVATVYPQAGPNRGFSWSKSITESGTYTVCVTALAVPGNVGGNTVLGCYSRFYSASIGASPTTSRIQGTDRYEVSIAASRAAFPGTAPVVYVVTGDKYFDALSAGPAAVKQGGPLLLTPTSTLLGNVAAEITRLHPAKIVVVGGPEAVSDGVLGQLSALIPGTSAMRIGGADRYEVSRNVAQLVFGSKAGGIYVATGTNFPDALSIGAAAGTKGIPVLIVDGSATTIDAPTKTALHTLGITSITVAGGPDSVSPGVVAALNAVAPTTRYSGAYRYDTSAAVNAAAFTSSSQVYLATGDNFPDALSGSALAGKQKAPLYVVQGSCVPTSVINEIVRVHASKVTLLGGPAALTSAVDQLTRC
jgi:putative cell wall-binding protein